MTDNWLDFKLQMNNEYDLSDQMLFTIIISLIHFITYYINSWFFTFADWYGFLDNYSIRSKSSKPSLKQQYEAIYESTFDSFIMKPVLFYLISPYLMKYFLIFNESIPTLQIIILEWIIMKFSYSTTFFIIHRILHTSYFYKKIHKRHHSFNNTIAFAGIYFFIFSHYNIYNYFPPFIIIGQYMHIIEMTVSSSHIFVALFLAKPHFISFCLFAATTFFEIVDAHSGYEVIIFLLNVIII
jgi:sterol desaturase/sphingolipid hydroxylase (fatty acid hydroxylase superfamily)